MSDEKKINSEELSSKQLDEVAGGGGGLSIGGPTQTYSFTCSRCRETFSGEGLRSGLGVYCAPCYSIVNNPSNDERR